MTPAQRGVIVALLAYAAERWAVGDYARAEAWARATWNLVGDDTFVDVEPEHR